MKRLLLSIALALLYGCGSNNDSSPSLNQLDEPSFTSESTDFTSVKVHEQQIEAKRSLNKDVTLNYNDSLRDNEAFLLTLTYENGSWQPVVGELDGNTVVTKFSSTPLQEDVAPKSISLFKITLPQATPPQINYMGTNTSGRATSELPIGIVLHGTFTNHTSMKDVANSINGFIPGQESKTRLVSNLLYIDYYDLQSITTSSQQIYDALHELHNTCGYKKLVVVGHSQGGLVARHLIEKRGMDHDVKKLVMLGTPNDGVSFAGLTTDNLIFAAGVTLNPALIETSLIAYFIANYTIPSIGNMMHNSIFLNDLNQPTHADTDYFTLAGSKDWVVSVNSCNWSGLANEARWESAVLPLGHSALHSHPSAMERVYNELAEVIDTGSESGSSSVTTYASIPASQTSSNGATSSSTASAPQQVAQQVVGIVWGHNAFFREKWEAAAARSNVGRSVEPSQMDGRDGRYVSGVSNRGYTRQRGENGVLYNLGTNVYPVEGEFSRYHETKGGGNGELGCPIGDQMRGLRSGVDGEIGEAQQFESGYIVKCKGLVTHVIGDFARVWEHKGKWSGELSFPADHRRSPKSGAPQYVNTNGGYGMYQPFQGGCIAEWSQTEHVITGGFFREYERTGGPSGPMGYPLTAKVTRVRSGCSARYGEEQIFQHGRICELGVNNAWAVYGGMLSRYSGPLYHHGFPRGPSTNNNHSQRFEEYTINW